MTGFDAKWEMCEGSAEEQKIVMVVHFRPDKLPEDHAQWYEWLGNYAHTTSELMKKGIIKTAEGKTE